MPSTLKLANLDRVLQAAMGVGASFMLYQTSRGLRRNMGDLARMPSPSGV